MHKALFALLCTTVFADATQNFPQLRAVRKYVNVTDTQISANHTTTHHTLHQNTSTIISQGSCAGEATYLNSVPPTVYLTITKPYNVTVLGHNATLPPAQLITPPVACIATVVSQGATEVPAAITDAPSNSVNSACPEGVCFPGIASPTSTLGYQPALTVVTVMITNSKNPYGPEIQSTAGEPPSTSTVIVTKKTPVPVSASSSSAPPVFQIPSTTKNAATAPTSKAGVGSSPPPPPSTAPLASSKAPPATFPNVGTTKAHTTNPVVSQPATTTQIGNIIASIINSPFTPVGSSSKAPAAPVSTKIDNVPVQVLSSSVVIGGQTVAIPDTSSKTTLEVNGQTYVVQNSAIIASGTTLAITPEQKQVSTTATASRVTAGSLTFSIDASQAIISGKTYAIGTGAGAPATLDIGSETLVLGSGGVIFPSTTVAPKKIATAPLPDVYTAEGVTFIVGTSLAVIAGTTYTIGPGAKSTDVVVNGETISIGSNGIGLASTTIAPEQIFSVITIDGITMSVDSSEAVISGTTYHIGKGATPTTEVVGGKTISLGPSGVALPGTTIPPESGAAPASTGTFKGEAASSSFVHWSALSAFFACIGAIAFL